MDYAPALCRQKRFNMPLPRHKAELIGQPAAREPDTLSGYWFRPSDAAQGSRLQGVQEAARTKPGCGQYQTLHQNGLAQKDVAMLSQADQSDQFALPATIIRMRDWQINPMPDDRQFGMALQKPKPRKRFQQEMSDMVHRKAPIDGCR
jgi:hypothetical protein